MDLHHLVKHHEFLDEILYNLNFKGGDVLVKSGDEMVDYYKKLVEDYNIVTIEDPFDQDDWENWSKLYASISDKCQIVGDDLTVTNKGRIKRAIVNEAANCLLLKVNQIGTITESIDSVNYSYSNSFIFLYKVRSEIPNSSAAFFLLPLLLIKAFFIISISLSNKDSGSSSITVSA